MEGLDFHGELVCSMSMDIERRAFVGDTPDGLRLTGYLAEGSVTGPRLSGIVARGAADWAVMRRDGVLFPEVKLLIETKDGAIIQVHYHGVVDMGKNAYEGLKRGERSGTMFHPRTAVQMLTASPDYLWVNRSLFFGIGLLDYRSGNGRIAYDIYELTTPSP